ncbi:MAG: hypothetical protein QXT26_05550 [Thermoproteota archaeon]
MITVDTKLLDIFSPVLYREAGWYLVDNPSKIILGASMDVNLNPAYIIGAAPYDLDFMSDVEIVEITVNGRENYPVTASADQLIATVETERKIVWKRIADLEMEDLIVIPACINNRWVLSASPLRSKRRSGTYRSKWDIHVMVSPGLKDDCRSYCAIGGLLHV